VTAHRDTRGRFVNQRAHQYAMRFDDGHEERVWAVGPTEAVNQRKGGRCALSPFAITDLTVLDLWVRGETGRKGIHLLPPEPAPEPEPEFPVALKWWERR
jgi:hypothetical protein